MIFVGNTIFEAFNANATCEVSNGEAMDFVECPWEDIKPGMTFRVRTEFPGYGQVSDRMTAKSVVKCDKVNNLFILEIEKPVQEVPFLSPTHGGPLVSNDNDFPKFQISQDPPKPPLGLRPRWIVGTERKREILEAMDRYNTAQMKIPSEWLEELVDLSS